MFTFLLLCSLGVGLFIAILGAFGTRDFNDAGKKKGFW